MPVELPLTEYLHRRAVRSRNPLNGTFELTPVCNMNCRMCYVRMSHEEQQAIAPLKTAEEWLSLAAECRDAGMLYLLLTGGEVFLRPDFKTILSGLSKMGFIISINTNGTLITEELVEWLKSNAPCRFNITLYGASDETYARLCGNPHGYSQATRAIDLLRAAGFLVIINISLTPYNIADLDAMYAFCAERKLQSKIAAYMFPPARKESFVPGENQRFTPEEAAAAMARIELLQRGREAFLQYNETRTFPVPMDEDCECTTEDGVVRCRAGRCTFWVTWDGKIMPCGLFSVEEDTPDVFQTGFTAAWQQVLAKTDSIRLPARCEACPMRDLCRPCAAVCISESGRFDAVPEYRCQMLRAYPDAIRRLVKEITHEA